MRAPIAFLFSLFILSQASASLYMEAGTGWRWEEESDGIGVNKSGVLSLALGYALPVVELVGEFSTFSRDDRDASLTVERRHYELLGWVRYAFFRRAQGALYGAAGAGFFWENVRTTVVNLSSESIGDPEFLLGGSLDYEYSFTGNWGGSAKLRVLLNTNNSASPVVDTLLRAVYRF